MKRQAGSNNFVQYPYVLAKAKLEDWQRAWLLTIYKERFTIPLVTISSIVSAALEAIHSFLHSPS
jgi:hypothetical protein